MYMFFFFFLILIIIIFYEIKKGLAGPNLTWCETYLDNNEAYHYLNPQLSNSQVWWVTGIKSPP